MSTQTPDFRQNGKGGEQSENGWSELIDQLRALQDRMLALEAESAGVIAAIPDAHRDSARNLLHYVALRDTELRPLQERLSALGLSSLGRSESNVLASVARVLPLVHGLAKRPYEPAQPTHTSGFADGEARLQRNADELFGPPPPGRGVRIMVTMPSEAAERYELVRDLVGAGMNCMRINCAHDSADAWARMIANLQRANAELAADCRVLMDLPGPKLRTGPVEDGPRVVKWKPERDALGRVRRRARVLFYDEARRLLASDADAAVPVGSKWLRSLRVGSRIRFVDARGAKRALRIREIDDHGAWATASKTAYVVPGTKLRTKGSTRGGRVGDLPAREGAIVLEEGASLVLTRELGRGRAAQRDESGAVSAPARIGCTAPEVFCDVRAGHRVLFDDGKIESVARTVSETEILVEITRTPPGGAKLRADKGINLPDTALSLGSPTESDLALLPFVAEHAHAVGLSFIREAREVENVVSRLAELGAEHVAVVLKIETQRAVEQLPALLLAGMGARQQAVMIARGDLAVEVGYARLAELQEEILWISEAAHVPAIWATQVLESAAKQGFPSRAEVTDAAAAERAECVMMNKGPHILGAVRMLDDILRRMQGHFRKKRAMLRPLHVAAGFLRPEEPSPK